MIYNCNGLALDLTEAKVMGILNCTPDSFYDGGNYNRDGAYAQIDKMISEGATIIDIGGMSSRPGAAIISPLEEWNRIEFAIHYIKKEHDTTIISIDTIHSEVADKALQLGAHIINDISAGNYDSQMLNVVGHSEACYVMMHMKGTPSNMQDRLDYPKGLLLEILTYFKNRIHQAEKANIKDIILDPGFGFSKNIDQNYELLNKLEVLKLYDKAILAGISRKSMIYKYLSQATDEMYTSENAINGTSALHMIALRNGAKILRVHDVSLAMECTLLHNKLKSLQ